MPRKIAIDELRNRMDAVVAAVLAGERLTLTRAAPAAPRATELERDFPFALARQPFEPLLDVWRAGLGLNALLAERAMCSRVVAGSY